jgi:hypothetical protein
LKRAGWQRKFGREIGDSEGLRLKKIWAKKIRAFKYEKPQEEALAWICAYLAVNQSAICTSWWDKQDKFARLLRRDEWQPQNLRQKQTSPKI